MIAGVAIVVTVWGLMLPLEVPLRGDELSSLFLYEVQGPANIWGHYITNDHMLYELLTWAFRGVTQDHTAAAVRFWAVLPATASLAGGAIWLWRRLDPWIAAVFAVLVAASPVFANLGDEGRGYGLMFLAALVMVIGADWAARTERTGALALFGAGALAGIWTSPVLSLAFATLALALIAKLGPRRQLMWTVVVVIVAAVAWYAPVADALFKLSGAGRGPQLSLFGFLTRPLTDLLQPSVQVVIHPLGQLTANRYISQMLTYRGPRPEVLAELIGAGAVALGLVELLRRVERFLAAALLAPAIVTYLAFELLRSHVIARFASFLLPGLLILVAAGLVGVARRIARTPALAAMLVAAGVAGCLFVAVRGYRLVTLDAHSHPVIYSNQPTAFGSYLDTRDITRVVGPQLRQMACEAPASFALLDSKLRPMPLATAECLQARHVFEATVVPARVGARTAAGLVLDVPAKPGRRR